MRKRRAWIGLVPTLMGRGEGPGAGGRGRNSSCCLVVSAGPGLSVALASGIYSLHVAMEKCKVNQIPSLPRLNAPTPAPLLPYNGRTPCDRGPGPPAPRPRPADSLASPARPAKLPPALELSPRLFPPPGLCRPRSLSFPPAAPLGKANPGRPT